jgi:hypothetical protein
MMKALMFSVITDTTQIHTGTTRGCVRGSFFFFFYFGLGSSSAFCLLEALQPVWLTPEVYCTIPVVLIVPTLAARCLSRPQPAVVPWQPGEELWAEIVAR